MPRQSAAVYRRRRLAVVLILVVVIVALAAGIWLVLTQPWGTNASPTPAGASSTPTPTPTPTGIDPASPPPSMDPAPTDSASPAPDPSATPGIVACVAADVEVKAVTDASTYAAGVMPKLSISLTNKTSHDCTLNVGSSDQTFTVSSGSDEWWRSTDCQTDPSSQIATLKAGATVKTKTPVVWDRTRSATDTCDKPNRPRAPGGGASYHVKVSIGGFDSTGTKQIILR